MAKATKKPLTKTEILSKIADATDLTKKDVGAVFDALSVEIKRSLGRSGAGAFTIPGLVKITKKKVKAQPAQKDWVNPFTKEVMDKPAKPASTKIIVRALKNLKDMV